MWHVLFFSCVMRGAATALLLTNTRISHLHSLQEIPRPKVRRHGVKHTYIHTYIQPLFIHDKRRQS